MMTFLPFMIYTPFATCWLPIFCPKGYRCHLACPFPLGVGDACREIRQLLGVKKIQMSQKELTVTIHLCLHEKTTRINFPPMK